MTPPAPLDDVSLLDRLMAELSAADPMYQPTNYWQLYQAPILGELRSLGLTGFRRRRHTLLDAFGATDTLIEAEVTVGGRWSARLSPIARRLFGGIPGVRADSPPARSPPTFSNACARNAPPPASI